MALVMVAIINKIMDYFICKN